MLNLLKRAFVGKPSFNVGDVTFDTHEALRGYIDMLQRGRSVNMQWEVMQSDIEKTAMPLTGIAARIPEHHYNLHSQFENLKRSTSLSTPVDLGIIDYHHPTLYAAAFDDKTIVLADTTALKLFSPEEIHASLGHELAHIEAGDPQAALLQKKGMHINRDIELAADMRGAEISRNPLGFASMLQKHEQYIEELCRASPFVEGVKKWQDFCMKHKGPAAKNMYPTVEERVDRLMLFAERIASDAAHGKIRIP